MNVLALGYVELESTDVARWQQFGTDVVGMMVSPVMPEADGQVFLKMDEYSWRISVRASDRDALSVAGWELRDAEALEQARAELREAGIEFEEGSADEAQARRVAGFIRLRDPSGLTLELFHEMELDYSPFNSPVGGDGFVTGYHGDMGLGHFVIPTDRFEETYSFYRKVLGFGQTDYMHFHFSPEPGDPGQGLHFLHVDNPRHHSLAIFQDPNPPASACVHLMVEVEGLDEVGYFMDRCKQHEVPIVSSLGRHTNDLMVSVYAASPSGFALEFGCDGVQLDWDNYKPTRSSRPSLWGHSWNVG